ncbi:hypothetical protein C1645_132029 [Glomus cerebriforme]|uniref:Uncharacterized protein n=1 Tax=Glomus cerebriforme TaxID=658196 RepID=A0A397SY76_9GLOM|nr:hypothetical protein C1645_132029 [Glomus cerebriforme]
MKIMKRMKSDQQVIRQLKLNHGLLMDGCNIQPSKQAIFIDDGELNVSLYDGQPIVYFNINDPDSLENLISFDSNEDNFNNNTLQPSDICINFPIAEITYKGNLQKSFLKCKENDTNLLEMYGHFFARKVLVGSKLFIKEISSFTQTQIEILKFYLMCAYNSVKYSIEIQFNSLFTLNLLPEMKTLDGEKLNTYEELINWMNDLYQLKTFDANLINRMNNLNNLYQMKTIDIISYDNLVSTSQLRDSISTIYDPDISNERQPGIINFKEKLRLEDWIGDAAYNNLLSWVIDFHLIQGFIINQNHELEISKKIAVHFIETPKVNFSDKSSLVMIRPSTKLEAMLISNNIFSIKNLFSFPFIKNDVESYGDYNHILVKLERHEIILNEDIIKPTKEFEHSIEKALDSIKPLKALQDVFNEYGHLFPQRIILGSSFKNILSNSSSYNKFDKINLESPIFDSLKPHLDSLNISCLLTQKGKNIEKNDLPNWIKDANDNLETIEFDNIIPLYKILKEEQQRKIDNMLENDFKIIMTGITDLKDLNNNNVEHYKHINLEFSLEDEDYEVFGSIISKNNLKSEEIYVNFGLYDFNGFFAIIKKLEELESASIDITKCYVLWMIIGIPSKLSVFSPNNRNVQVKSFAKTITLQPNQLYYPIETPCSLSEGYIISVHAYYPLTNCEPDNIVKLAGWKDKFINVKIVNASQLNFNSTSELRPAININLHICVLCSDYKSLRIGNKEGVELPLDLMGYILTKENFDENI